MLPSLRAALAGCAVLSVAAALSGPAAAESPACADIAARWAAQKADLQTPQISAMLFSASDNDCAQVAETLLAAGALLEAKDRFGNTPLAHGADIGHQNVAGSSALFVAIERHHPNAAVLLIERGADPNVPGRSGATPLAAAAFGGEEDSVAALLAHHADPKVPDRTGKAPIVYAAARGRAGIVKLLLAAGVDINARYENDLTALMWGAGHADGVPEREGLAVVTLLLDGGAHVDDADNRGRTALMIAAERGHAGIAKLLLAHGANVGLHDKQGKSALDLAADDATRAILTPG